MRLPGQTVLVLQVLCELACYDLAVSLLRRRPVPRHPARLNIPADPHDAETQSAVLSAVTLAACFYWKRILCLQRSVVTAKLLRRHGIDAQVVIGVTAVPFFGHAWVEVAGHIVNDSPAYQRMMQVLQRV